MLISQLNFNNIYKKTPFPDILFSKNQLKIDYFFPIKSVLQVCFQLARRPTKLTTSEDVKVKVEDRLAALLAVVDHDPVTLGQAAVLGHLASSQKKLAKNLEFNNQLTNQEKNFNYQ